MKRIAAFALLAATLIGVLTGAAYADGFVRHESYPFSLEVPASWVKQDQKFVDVLRASIERQSAEMFKDYHRADDSPFSRVPFLIAFESQDGKQRAALTVVRIVPQDESYMDTVVKGIDDVMKYGKEHGLVERLLRKERGQIGSADSLRMTIQKKGRAHSIVAYLYDPDLPYQFVQFNLDGKGTPLADDEGLVDRILRTMRVDFALSVTLRGQRVVLSKKLQEFLIVTERRDAGRKDIVLIVQDPHWDADAQWSVCQGLRVLFAENPDLMAKSAFLAEGAETGSVIDISPLTKAVPTPHPNLVKATLSSYLIGGYVAYDWIEGQTIPVMGVEDADLYRRSAQLWISDKEDAWTATVSMRNERIAASLLAARETIDNPMLFVGGMHLRPVDKKQFEKGERETGRPGGKNRGITEWLDDARVGYIYLEPVPNMDQSGDRRLIDRYRNLMAAQSKGEVDRYVATLASDLPTPDLGSAEREAGRVTVAPSPAQAAALATALSSKASKSGNEKKPDSDSKAGKKNPIDRFKDPLSGVNLRGKNLKSGRKALKDADPNLVETREKSGRHEWKDANTGRLRARYDPKGAHEDAHWDKWAPGGERIDNAGRPGVAEHIPAK